MVNITLEHKDSVSYRPRLLHKSIDTADIMHEVRLTAHSGTSSDGEVARQTVSDRHTKPQAVSHKINSRAVTHDVTLEWPQG